MTARTPLAKAHQRLEHLYEISKLFASFETVQQTFDPALGIVARTLPLRGAILMEIEDGRSRVIVWSSEDQGAEQRRVAREHLESASAYLLGPMATAPVDVSAQAGNTALPRHARTEANPSHRFIVIPLVVAGHLPFGALQLEGARALDRRDLRFVNAVANQLAIALDRDRARRRDITRRERAEDGKTHAEARGVAATRERIVAEDSSTKYEALASENAALYERAQRAVRAREQVLAIVSHDLRNPLSTILMATQVLAKASERASASP